jgi:hypothetical protein
MRPALLTLLLPCLAAALRADYVAVALARSPFCMIGETTKLGVARGMALVEGHYDYKYVPRFDRGPRSETVTFEFPVLVPRDAQTVTDVTDIMQPKLRVGTVDYTPDDLGAWKRPVGATLPFVPDNIKVVLLIFDIPRALLQERCELSLTYFQPTYRFAGREVVAYLPRLPDFEALKNELLFSRLDFTVEFDAVDQIRLQRLSANESVAKDSPAMVTVHPVDGEIIAVAIEPAPPAAKPPAAAR